MPFLWNYCLMPTIMMQLIRNPDYSLLLIFLYLASLSRIAHWKHLEVNALGDSRIYSMDQSNSSTYEFRYLHRVIRDNTNSAQ